MKTTSYAQYMSAQASIIAAYIYDNELSTFEIVQDDLDVIYKLDGDIIIRESITNQSCELLMDNLPKHNRVYFAGLQKAANEENNRKVAEKAARPKADTKDLLAALIASGI